MSKMLRYAETVREFKWNVPEHFNFGADIVDHYARHGDGLALIWASATGAEERFTYADMARLTSKLASALRERGIVKGDRVLIMLPRIPQWQIAMVACLKLGAVPIPCIEMLTAKDLAYRIEQARPKAVIARQEHVGKFSESLNHLPVRVSIGEAPGWEPFATLLESGSESCAPEKVAAEDPAILYFTSGSTGPPKGVLHASRALYAWRASALHWLDLQRDDVIWCTADVGWSKAGTSILFGPWSRGACSFFYDGPFDTRERLRLLEKYAISVYCASATELLRVLNEDFSAFNLRKLRRTVTAGEALNPVIDERWHAATGLHVAEAYGQTESLMTLLNVPGLPAKPGSMGLAAPGTVLEILGPDGGRLGPAEEGDLAILAPNPQLMMAYWQDPERTAQCYLEGPEGRWFMTGDRAIRDEEGYFFHRGRRDDVINSAGYRIGPSEVENALLEHAAVQETAVVGAPDAERGEIVVAYVVLRAGYAPSPALMREIQDHVKATTAPYKYPRAIRFIEELPKTQTGKVQRVALRTLEKQRLASQTQK